MRTWVWGITCGITCSESPPAQPDVVQLCYDTFCGFRENFRCLVAAHPGDLDWREESELHHALRGCHSSALTTLYILSIKARLGRQGKEWETRIFLQSGKRLVRESAKGIKQAGAR